MLKRNIVLVILLGIILGVLSWYYYLHTQKYKYSFPGYDIENADFFGATGQGKAFNVKANYAKKISPSVYNLNTIYCKYFLDPGREKYIEVISPTGVLNEEKSLLDLNGGVEFIASYGYRMLTENFFIDLNKHISTTKDEVLVSGAQGKVVSKDGMIIYMKDKKITFHGPIKSMFIENDGKSLGTDEAIYINSDTLDVDYENGIAEYKTNVFVQKNGGFDLYCDRAKIFFVIKQATENKIKASSGNIKRIELYDNITIVKEQKTAKGDSGVIYPKEKLIILTGNVALKDKTDKREGYLEGSEVRYYMNEGVFKVKNEDASKKGRVKIILGETKKSQ